MKSCAEKALDKLFKLVEEQKQLGLSLSLSLSGASSLLLELARIWKEARMPGNADGLMVISPDTYMPFCGGGGGEEGGLPLSTHPYPPLVGGGGKKVSPLKDC